MKPFNLTLEESTALLAAIVDSSDDAIVSKTLDGVITSWNRGAERIFGYTAEEAIGQNIKLIIPLERHPEEDNVLAQIRRGEKVDHFQTVRRAKETASAELTGRRFEESAQRSRAFPGTAARRGSDRRRRRRRYRPPARARRDNGRGAISDA